MSPSIPKDISLMCSWQGYRHSTITMFRRSKGCCQTNL